MKTTLTIAAVIAWLLWTTWAAAAHGWYSPYCCSGKDCAPAKISVNPDGSITATNQFRPSKDGRWHACIHPTLGPRCLYVPAGM